MNVLFFFLGRGIGDIVFILMVGLDYKYKAVNLLKVEHSDPGLGFNSSSSDLTSVAALFIRFLFFLIFFLSCALIIRV